ncbi:MAG: glycosyltransferase family 2 protein [Candidatus Omnitrophota bacterium]
MDISISIVNFNTREQLRRCISSIKENTQGFEYEIIVVDNNSSDESVSMVRQEFPFVKLIANSENIGAAKAKNQSFEYCSGKYILILDSDIEILPDAINKMFAFAEMHPEIGILGPKVLFPNYRQQHSCNKSAPGIFSCFLNKIFYFSGLRYRFYRTRPGSLYLKMRYARSRECLWLGGMCLLARREVIHRLKGFDENFFIYYDDTDFCFCAKKSGWNVFYLADAAVIHHMGKGARQVGNLLYSKIAASELHFFKKHYGKSKANKCAYFTQVAMVMRIVCLFPFYLLGLKRKYFKTRLKAYRELFRQAGDFIREKTN